MVVLELVMVVIIVVGAGSYRSNLILWILMYCVDPFSCSVVTSSLIVV